MTSSSTLPGGDLDAGVELLLAHETLTADQFRPLQRPDAAGSPGRAPDASPHPEAKAAAAAI